jgi:hypothetical protein
MPCGVLKTKIFYQRISDLDVTANHDRARTKHVPKTGDWLLQHEIYKDGPMVIAKCCGFMGFVSSFYLGFTTNIL